MRMRPRRQGEMRSVSSMRTAVSFLAVALAAAFVLVAGGGLARAANCSVATTAQLEDALTPGGTCTAGDNDTITLAAADYASTGPLVVTQHNLTIVGPQSPVGGRGAIISGGNSTAGTQETIDVKGDTNPTASLTLRNVSVRN